MTLKWSWIPREVLCWFSPNLFFNSQKLPMNTFLLVTLWLLWQNKNLRREKIRKKYYFNLFPMLFWGVGGGGACLIMKIHEFAWNRGTATGKDARFSQRSNIAYVTGSKIFSCCWMQWLFFTTSKVKSWHLLKQANKNPRPNACLVIAWLSC